MTHSLFHTSLITIEGVVPEAWHCTAFIAHVTNSMAEGGDPLSLRNTFLTPHAKTSLSSQTKVTPPLPRVGPTAGVEQIC